MFERGIEFNSAQTSESQRNVFFLQVGTSEGIMISEGSLPELAGHTREQQAEQQAAYISGYDMGVYDQEQKDNFTLDEAYVAVYDVAYEAGCLDQKEMYRIETQNYISREEIASQMISDLLDAQEQVVKVDAFVYMYRWDVHKTCRRASLRSAGELMARTRTTLFSLSCSSSLRSDRLGENVPSGGHRRAKIFFCS